MNSVDLGMGLGQMGLLATRGLHWMSQQCSGHGFGL